VIVANEIKDGDEMIQILQKAESRGYLDVA